MTNATALATRALAPTTPPAKPAAAKPEAADLSLGFGDLLDAVNPLQHLPGVSQVYRHATGDEIGLPARLAGGFLFGGPIGLLGSAAMAAFEAVTGDDPLGHLVALAEGGSDETKAPAKDAPSNAPPLPFLASPGQEPPADHRPSPAVLAEALARKTPSTDAAADVSAPKAEQPAPQILAKLYELHATQPADRPAVRL
ncbi:hypothetical protein [Azospirillum argentinense]|uniref:Uncharacterized protein n=1 Tax=Azospirillum brasilense TaxID=192 RepID=A0A4D8QB03_AZOBR|nr:hypothetical protein [Azospirillum argentinense]QCO06591.1 hypothetical protein D3867_32210 [Azospirillum argentinense]